jgi:hypothetical protein
MNLNGICILLYAKALLLSTGAGLLSFTGASKCYLCLNIVVCIVAVHVHANLAYKLYELCAVAVWIVTFVFHCHGNDCGKVLISHLWSLLQCLSEPSKQVAKANSFPTVSVSSSFLFFFVKDSGLPRRKSRWHLLWTREESDCVAHHW